MGKKNPAVNPSYGLLAKSFSGYVNCGRNRGEPVEPVDYGEDKKARKGGHIREDEKREAA